MVFQANILISQSHNYGRFNFQMKFSQSEVFQFLEEEFFINHHFEGEIVMNIAQFVENFSLAKICYTCTGIR